MARNRYAEKAPGKTLTLPSASSAVDSLSKAALQGLVQDIGHFILKVLRRDCVSYVCIDIPNGFSSLAPFLIMA